MADSPAILWLTDRSRIYNGLGRCKRLRYLTNHFGPTGYGMVRQGQSLPLATGKFTHAALETLFRHLATRDTFPTVEIIRDAISTACLAYEAEIAAKGFRGLLASERTDYVVVEQQTLLAGLVWTFARTVLPWIFTHYKIVEAEQESLFMLDASTAIMLRQDCIAVHRGTGAGAYFEFKTTGWLGEAWSSQWETKPQLPIGTFGVKERLGIDITESFIVGLYKGKRAKFQHPTYGEIYRQESPLVYGYCRPGNPPLATDDWVPGYEWVDSHGQTKRKSRQHEKRGIWEFPQSDWDVWVESKASDPTLTPVEFWSAWLPESVITQQVFLIGPMRQRPEHVAGLQRQILGEEQHWKEILWRLHDLQAQGVVWKDPSFQQELDYLVPPSWDCRRYGAGHECEFVDLCWKQPNWETPLDGGTYVARRPHHQPELDQAISRGLLPADAAEESEGEE